jgi:hypothetical protein
LFGENVPDPNWKLKIIDVTEPDGRVKNFQYIRELFGLHVNIEMYNSFCTAVFESRFVRQKSTVNTVDTRNMSLENFLTWFKKGSRPFRKVFELNRCKKVNVREKRSVKTFFRLIDIEIPVAAVVEKINTHWSCFFLSK